MKQDANACARLVLVVCMCVGSRRFSSICFRCGSSLALCHFVFIELVRDPSAVLSTQYQFVGHLYEQEHVYWQAQARTHLVRHMFMLWHIYVYNTCTLFHLV